ncbi:hypothetical protein [Photobacterium angustum]|uniref:hypothetical protein n=1 Tax=Photobacterium angustum TaxID=661 RepID=UPI0005E99DAE|nr:hypothetical protein [Photobacterium angustum]KJG02710.1 hypothetical protein UB35_07750 [Photobacterium angustum]KJG18378.1 hypothetical protein UA33_05965 [Photobacterium angustum]KJG26469.1 hypothetical protein UA39_01935 [Photobacterium angustum]KJG29252.1 hypothetical protein UA36_15580 [Photobacterium angustum]PSV68563.1 hypothetical protein CTM95_04335 [Photobacterium angustum]
MTKLFPLSAIALLTGLSTAASAASLDVHGEIKINGKTVIDDKGNLIQDQSDLINIDDYANAAPNRVVTLTAPVGENGIASTYKITYDEKGREYKEESFTDNKLVWSIKWEERTTAPLAHKRTVLSDWGSEDPITTTYQDEFTTSSSYPLAQVGVSVTRADIYTSTVISTNNPDIEINSVTNNLDYQKLTVIDKTSFKMGDTTIDDCIIVTMSASWTQGDQFRTFCKDYGLVKFGDFTAQAAE